jgi:hypothetical protein
MNQSQGDWQARIGDPDRDRLTTRLTLHTMLSSHKRCFGSSILGKVGTDLRSEPTCLLVQKARAPYWCSPSQERVSGPWPGPPEPFPDEGSPFHLTLKAFGLGAALKQGQLRGGSDGSDPQHDNTYRGQFCELG